LGDELAGETVQIRTTVQKLYIYSHDRLVASYILSEPHEEHEMDQPPAQDGEQDSEQDSEQDGEHYAWS
jgi:hypothetical protein